MRNLLKVELFKIMKRPRTYIGFGTILFIILAFQFALAAEGDAIIGMGIQNLKSVFRFEGEIITVNFVTYMLMTTLIIHVPILVCLVTGDMISGEASKGSLRLLVQRPYTRGQIFMAKWLAGAIYTIALLLFAAIMTYALGYLLFGSGDLIVFRKGINVLEANDVAWRFICGFGVGTLAMLVVSSLSMMISSFVNNSIGPIVGTIAIIIILNVLSALLTSLLQPVLPYIFTTHFIKWQYFFDSEIDWGSIYNAIFVLIAYIVVFTLIGWWNFKRKDILT
ncbi:MAG: ABC transporter permease [Flavobacteriales bacterium]|nr:ABC transporter permease [Flavobacteriales bacterium]